MRKILLFLFFALLLSFACCKKVDPKAEPTQAMNAILQKLKSNDFDAYLACADLSGEDDSAHMELYKQLLSQHKEYQDKTKGEVAKYEVVDINFDNDSLCTALYQIVFADSTKEVCSQKMVRLNGKWKIKIRN